MVSSPHIRGRPLETVFVLYFCGAVGLVGPEKCWEPESFFSPTKILFCELRAGFTLTLIRTWKHPHPHSLFLFQFFPADIILYVCVCVNKSVCLFLALWLTASQATPQASCPPHTAWVSPVQERTQDCVRWCRTQHLIYLQVTVFVIFTAGEERCSCLLIMPEILEELHQDMNYLFFGPIIWAEGFWGSSYIICRGGDVAAFRQTEESHVCVRRWSL